MLRVVALALVGLAAAWLACSLPVDEKTGCVTSADCVEDRICDEGHCVPGGCGVACVQTCDRLDDCGQGIEPDCAARCIEEDGGVLPGFGADDCKRQWDVLFATENECDAVDCLIPCRDLCVLAGGCALIVDVPACTVGCQEDEAGCVGMVTGCFDVPAKVQCWESGAC